MKQQSSGDEGQGNLYHPGLLQVRANPYPFYESLQDKSPVYFHPQLNAWLLTRYQDVLTSFRDLRFSSNRLAAFSKFLSPEEKEKAKPLLDHLGGWGFYRDPPSQTRVRSLYAKAFSPHVMDNLRNPMRELAEELVDSAMARGTFDLMKEVASPLPVMVIAELLGVPRADAPLIKKWADDITQFVAAPMRTFPLAEMAMHSVQELDRYFRSLIADRRASPREDLISKLLFVEENRATLTDEEVISTCSMFAFAGHETTTALIGNAVAALIEHPEQLAKVRRDSSLVAGAVEETLRYDCPVQIIMRAVSEDMEFRGHELKAGQGVMLMLGAANRDPLQFENASAFDVERETTSHLAFGQGIHFCVGAQLARMEGQIVIRTLLGKMPNLKLAPQTKEWGSAAAIRCLKHLYLENSI